MKLFFQIVCGPLCSSNPLTTVEWYLVFTSLCIVLSQLPNLNSIAGLSLIGAVTAITYSTMVWVLSISQQRPPTISYEPLSLPSSTASLFSVLNALGIIAFAFRGHNLVLEIQVCILWALKRFTLHLLIQATPASIIIVEFVELGPLMVFNLLLSGNYAINIQAPSSCSYVERSQSCLFLYCNVLVPCCNWRLLGLRKPCKGSNWNTLDSHPLMIIYKYQTLLLQNCAYNKGKCKSHLP